MTPLFLQLDSPGINTQQLLSVFHQRLVQGGHEIPVLSGLTGRSAGFLHEVLFSFALNGPLWQATLDILFLHTSVYRLQHPWMDFD